MINGGRLSSVKSDDIESETEQPFLPLSKPAISESDIEAVVEVLRSGWITTGSKCAEFEHLVAETVGCQHAIALTSATAGMHLALYALDIGPGDEVITPSMTWVSTINLITACGATAVFADIDRDNLMVSAGTIEPLISERTRLIVPVHYAGAAADLDPLRALARRHKVPLFEDAAHALGTAYKGRAIGAEGTAIFSFHPIKNITTGEGGMFCTDDAALAERIRRLKFHGLGADAFDRHSQGRAPQAEVQEPGFKYNLPDMNAVLGIGQVKHLASLNSRRAELAAMYRDALRSVAEIQPLSVPAHTTAHAWHLFVVRLNAESAGIDRNTFIEELKARGIGSGLHFRAAHTQKFYRERYRGEYELGNTEWNSERICSLPLFPDMRDADVARVVKAIKHILRKT
jgi:UDP-4-amino-4-deoxy-L-arabinose-oxoglutarate aminotransferase